MRSRFSATPVIPFAHWAKLRDGGVPDSNLDGRPSGQRDFDRRYLRVLPGSA